jgi:thiol:disulfide interchange protein
MSEAPRFKVIGLVVGIAVVALGAGFFLLSSGQQSSSAAATHTVIPLSQRKHTKTAAKAKAKAKAKHVAPAAKPKPKPPAKNPPAAAEEDGLPLALTAALAHSRVVVVSLYAPRVELDSMALQEAKAGAAQAGAGFLAVNVLSEAESRQLTKQLGVLEDPAVLVFKRPGDLVTRFSGFADKQTILQAARNAAQ